MTIIIYIHFFICNTWKNKYILCTSRETFSVWTLYKFIILCDSRKNISARNFLKNFYFNENKKALWLNTSTCELVIQEFESWLALALEWSRCVFTYLATTSIVRVTLVYIYGEKGELRRLPKICSAIKDTTFYGVCYTSLNF